MKKNKHIIEFLNYYLSLKTSPEYAVLLRGKWGCGKSWLIKNFIRSNKEHEFIYVSLYGVNSYSDIENSFFEQLHPLMASKGAKIFSKIAKAGLKGLIKLDFNNDNKDDVNINFGVPDIKASDFFTKLEKRIIIFDDLERCSLPIQNIMGYMTQFVENSEIENSGLRMIIIANEEEILKSNLSEEKNKETIKLYSKIKEKLVGRSFDIETDFGSAYDEFIKAIQNKNLEKILKSRKDLIEKCFIASEYKNLRHLRQTILDFDRFYEFLPESALKHNKLLDHLIDLFFAISFEIKKGDLKENEINQLFHIDYLAKKKEDDDTLPQKIRKKYPVFGLYYHPIGENLLQRFITYGTLEKENVKQSIESSNYYLDSKTPPWKKLWHFYQLEDDEFEALSTETLESLKLAQIDNRYILVHVVGTLLYLSQTKLINIPKKKILSLAYKNIDSLKESNGLILNKHEEFPNNSYSGLTYNGSEIKEFKEFINRFNKEIEKFQSKNHPLIAMKILDSMRESMDDFSESIVYGNSEKNIYYDVPILYYIKPADFIDAYLKIPNKLKRQLGWAMNRRYKYPEFNTKILQEKKWLISVKRLIKPTQAKIKGKITGFKLENELLPLIQNCIKAFDTPLT